MPTLTLAHSPDADDLAMWWPLVGQHGSGPRVDTGPFAFELIGADVEQLNTELADGQRPYDLCAISAAAYTRVSDRYRITACGSSFGEGYGPKLVTQPQAPIASDPVAALRAGASLAVPGRRTTAFAVLRIAAGQDLVAEPLPFLEIAPAVAAGEYDLGLLIHEAQLTFEDQGLQAALDLGAWWQEHKRTPLPLGLNVITRDLDERFGQGSTSAVCRALDDSIDFALANPDDTQQALLAINPDRTEWQDRALLDRYLSMYVSPLTRDMGRPGLEALESLYTSMHDAGLIDATPPLDIARAEPA